MQSLSGTGLPPGSPQCSRYACRLRSDLSGMHPSSRVKGLPVCAGCFPAVSHCMSCMHCCCDISLCACVGSCRLMAEFMARYLQGAKIWIPKPTWSNHHKCAQYVLSVYHYPLVVAQFWYWRLKV